MRNRMWATLICGIFLVAALSLALSACGGGGDSTDSATQATEASTDESASGGGSTSSSLAAAEKHIAPYVGQPSEFSVTEKLKEVPEGATIAYMDCGSPTCALFYELMVEPAKLLGVHLERIKSGLAPQTIATGFDTAVAQHPDAVIVAAASIELWSKQLKELQEAEIPVVTVGVSEAEKYGVVAPQLGTASNTAVAELLANYVPVELNPEANVVYYESPEISFTTQQAEVFAPTLEAACPKCSVRIAKIPAANIGKTSLNDITSDLQANPETDVAVTAIAEMFVGLPSALKTAGIEVDELTAGPLPANLEQIKKGEETAALGYSLPIESWTLMDLAIRQIVGQKPAGPEAGGQGVEQFLKQPDIDFDPSKGFVGYPDFAERFEKLWGIEG